MDAGGEGGGGGGGGHCSSALKLELRLELRLVLRLTQASPGPQRLQAVCRWVGLHWPHPLGVDEPLVDWLLPKSCQRADHLKVESDKRS